MALEPDGAGISAPIFLCDIHASPAQVPLGLKPQVGVEPEIAFSFCRDLPPRPAGQPYSREQVLDAVGGAHPVLEIVLSRYASLEAAPALDRLADNCSNGGLVVGPICQSWRTLKLPELELALSVQAADGSVATLRQRGGHPLGDPLLPLLWFVGHYSERGLWLRAGQIVTTGSCAGMRYVGADTRTTAEFAALGRAQLQLNRGQSAGGQ